MERTVPSQTFVTGLNVEKRSITWTISDFPLIRKQTSMVNDQFIDFCSGEASGHPSQWKVCLNEQLIDGKRWIGIFLYLKSPNVNDSAFKTSHVGVQFIVKNQAGIIVKDEDTGPMHIGMDFADAFTRLGSSLEGFDHFIDANDETNDCPVESLVIHITFKLYSSSQLQSASSVETIMKKFQDKFLDQFWKDATRSGLLQDQAPYTAIKVISSDKKEFSVARRLLIARSEVFAAMFNSDMIEANSGVIELPDISSNALKILIYFLSTGELLPGWKETNVIVELTNAAAKYQLQDLLQFLDMTIGKVCQLSNAGPLLILSQQLYLKVAEEELKMFVKREWPGCAENFVKMWSGEPPMSDDESDDDDDDEPQDKKQKLG